MVKCSDYSQFILNFIVVGQSLQLCYLCKAYSVVPTLQRYSYEPFVCTKAFLGSSSQMGHRSKDIRNLLEFVFYSQTLIDFYHFLGRIVLRLMHKF